MKHSVLRLCLLLLPATLGGSAGCTNLNVNPAYFPYFFPTPYHNYDPDLARLAVQPSVDITRPVRTQHTVLVTAYDKDNTPRRGRQVEFMIAGAGSIVDVAPTGLLWRRKSDQQHALSETACFEHELTDGDKKKIAVRPGQTWCTLTSAVEGDTHVTVYAPGISDWNKRLVYTTIHWVDAAWTFPVPAQVRAGSQHVLTTHLTRHTTNEPLANYRVRYKIETGPGAVFIPSQSQEYVAVSDLSGNAQVAIVETLPVQGITRVGIEVIRAPDPSSPGGSGVSLARGETTIEWLAPAINLTHTGPTLAIVGGTVTYETIVNNIGKVESKSMTVTSTVPDGLQYVSSDPPAFVDGRNLVWPQGLLPPGQSQKPIRTTYKTLRQGMVSSIATVVTDEGQKDEKRADTNVTTAALKVGITGPQTVNVGQVANFSVSVTNPGGTPLDNIVVTAIVSDGLEHDTKNNTLNIKIGSLPAQQTYTEPLPLVARQPGRQTVKITATSASLSDQAEAAVIVQQPPQPKVKLEIDGLPKTKYVGRPAEWNLVLTNPGDTVLNDVVVRDRLPVELQFTDADQGGLFKDGEVLWNVGQLKPRERRVLKVKTVGKEAGQAVVHLATVTAEAGVRDEARALVDILKTPAGQNMEVTMEGNPVQVGKTITYKIVVRNSGDLPLQQIDVKAVVPAQLKILSAKGPNGKEVVKGLTIQFARVDSLEKGRPLEFTVEAEGLASGDVRFRAELKTRGGEPQVWEQATTIFDTNAGPQPPPPPLPPP